MQDTKSTMCGFYCISFIEYMLVGKRILHHTNLLFPNDYKKNDKIMYKYFKDKPDRSNSDEEKLVKQEIIF